MLSMTAEHTALTLMSQHNGTNCIKTWVSGFTSPQPHHVYGN